MTLQEVTDALGRPPTIHPAFAAFMQKVEHVYYGDSALINAWYWFRVGWEEGKS